MTSIDGPLYTISVISILGQVVLLRELSAAFFGVERTYILAVGFWLLWSAVLGRRCYVPSARTLRSLSLLLFTFRGLTEVAFSMLLLSTLALLLF